MKGIFVGCVTRLPEPHSDRYFNVEMDVDEYPLKEQAKDLVDFIQPNTVNIVDEVVYVIDKISGLKVWEIEDNGS